jgi:hypothetical protein
VAAEPNPDEVTMRAILMACAAAVLLSPAGCQTPRNQGAPPEVPAVIVRPTAASRAALARAVSAALDGVKVTLADDALTRESVLVLEHTPRRDPYGRPLSGRDLGMPERFQLLKRGDQCVLVHERTGRRTTLLATSCVDAP